MGNKVKMYVRQKMICNNKHYKAKSICGYNPISRKIYFQKIVYKCKVCRKSTSEIEKLEMHIKEHLKEMELKMKIGILKVAELVHKLPHPTEFMERVGNVMFYSKDIKA